MLVPFMDKDEVGAIDHFRHIGVCRVADRAEFGIGGTIGVEPLRPVIGDEVGEAPSVFGRVDADVMAAGEQFAHYAAQEMGVAMVPAGGEAVGEIDDFHAAAFRAGRCAAIVSR
jgi:hypothetical protein